MSLSRLASSLLLCLSLLFSNYLFCQGLSNISFGSEYTFEVVTWNIEWFPKNGSATVDSVSTIIQALDVDLLGLQEIDDTTICRQMIDNLPGFDLFMDNEWFGGLAYVYKTNTIDIQSIYKIYDTSEYWNAFPRSPLVIELTYMDEDFVIINNHFKCCGDGYLDVGNTSDEEARRYEASSLLKTYIDLNFPSKRVMVIGDLNDILNDEVSSNVFQMYLDDPENYTFADLEIANGPSSNWSFPGWPSHLDHILVTNEISSDLSNEQSTVTTIKVDNFMEDGWDDYDYYVSDHRPVGLKLEVTPTPQNMDESLNPQITVYPNPTQGHVKIDLRPFQLATEIIITDLKGKLISNKTFQENNLIEFDINAPAGIYLMSVKSELQVAVTKLLVK